ncbi:MAG: glycerate kinase [Flavobacteriales bacterium]
MTGEGKLDHQTLSGKASDKVKQHQVPVATFCGSVDLKKKELETLGIKYSASILEEAIHLNDALKNTENYLKNITIKLKETVLN